MKKGRRSIFTGRGRGSPLKKILGVLIAENTRVYSFCYFSGTKIETDDYLKLNTDLQTNPWLASRPGRFSREGPGR